MGRVGTRNEARAPSGFFPSKEFGSPTDANKKKNYKNVKERREGCRCRPTLNIYKPCFYLIITTFLYAPSVRMQLPNSFPTQILKFFGEEGVIFRSYGKEFEDGADF